MDNVMVVPRNQGMRSLVPDRMRTIHRWARRETVDPAPAGGVTDVVYRANDVFNPNGGAGGQPLGFDQYATLYSAFRVVGAKITVDYCSGVIPDPIESTRPVVCFLQLIKAAAGVTTLDALIEQDRTVYSIRDPTGGNKAAVTLQMQCNPQKYLGTVYPDTAACGTDTASPAILCHFNVGVGAIQASEDPNPIALLVVIEYITEWFSPKEVVTS